MKIDLHVHSKNCSDGKMVLEDIFEEANNRNIDMISITDHDSMDCQQKASSLADKYGIRYITGMELNITFSHETYTNGKDIALDFLAYNYDPSDKALKEKLKTISSYRDERALKILEKINAAFEEDGIEKLTETDIRAIQDSVDGVFGRPHIAHYLVDKGIVADKQEAFDRYLVKCNVPKYPLGVREASRLVRDAGGILVLAHPDDPNGTSMVRITSSLTEQTRIIENSFLSEIDGIECWHSRHKKNTAEHYAEFAKQHNLMITGGSDCHQNPMIMGTVEVPDFVAAQFDELLRRK